MTTRFKDRIQAGQLLAQELSAYANCPNGIVLGLPRGGVPVAFEVAIALHLPLDVCLVRKLGTPGHPELAMGAIAPGGTRILNQDVIRLRHIPGAAIEKVTAQEEAELERRNQLYRGDRPIPNLYDRTVILVDDGIATGATLRAAIALVQQQTPARIVVAVPVASPSTCQQLSETVDEVICVSQPDDLYAIGLWYEHFNQTSDEEVQSLLRQAQVELSMA